MLRSLNNWMVRRKSGAIGLSAPIVSAALLLAGGSLVTACGHAPLALERPPVEYHADTSGRLDLTAVAALPAQMWRTTGAEPRLNFGYSSATYWLRFPIEPVALRSANATANANEEAPPEAAAPSEDALADSVSGRVVEVRNPHLDRVRVYFFQGEEMLAEFTAGDLLPFAERPVDHRHFVFPIPPRADRAYVEVESQGSLMLDLTISDRLSFRRQSNAEIFLFGSYYGILILMAFFYVLVAFVFKRRNSVYYVLHVLTYGLFQLTLDGLGFQYIWPGHPAFENLAMLVLVPVTVLSAAWFVRSFLITWANAPLIDRGLVALSAVCALSIPFCFIGDYSLVIRVQTAISGVFGLLALAAGIQVYPRYRPARFFLAAWSIFLLGIVGYALFISGVLPGLYIARYGLQIGSVVEMSILSVAILDRIREYRRQREQARTDALRHEREQTRLKAELNERLEEEVQRKTGELAGALTELQRRDRVIKRELQMAADIQSGILPPESLELKGLRVGSYHSFMTGVGGDYFDIYRISENRVGLVMADVSGHGIPAALVTVMAKISFMNVTRRNSSPMKVLEIVNRVLARTLSPLTSLSYLTAFFISIDENYYVHYTSAAHVATLVYRKGSGAVDEWDRARFGARLPAGRPGALRGKRRCGGTGRSHLPVYRRHHRRSQHRRRGVRP